MKKHYTYIIGILILIFLLMGCANNSMVYKNKGYRYKIEGPKDWILLSAKTSNKNNKEFEKKVLKDKWMTDFDAEDACFYNPESEGPIFESIRIHAKDAKINIKESRENISQIGQMLTLQMVKKYQNVRNYYAEVVKFRKGEAIRFDFSFEYEGQAYVGIFMVIPGRIYATFFISGICKKEDSYRFEKTYQETLDTFTKF